MLKVIVLPSTRFTSNTFLFKCDNVAGLVDCGLVVPRRVRAELSYPISFALITHYHYDHVYGLNSLKEEHTNVLVYGSEHTIEGLYDPKINLSFYHEDPVVYSGPEPVAIAEGEHVISGLKIIALATPGHNPGCLTYIIEDAMFTGDAYIPFVPVVTKLKGGSRRQAAESLLKIKHALRPGMTIYPGHGPAFPADENILHDINAQINRLRS